jgi:dissimilatory sulfite reductase related protein
MINSDTTGVPRDVEGYLINPKDWNRTIARALAAAEGVELNNDHWIAIDFMREYCDGHSIAADIRHLIVYLADKRHWEKKQAKKLIFELFPYGYVRQACKIAGMMRPRAWSTG